MVRTSECIKREDAQVRGRWEASGGVVWCSACGAVIARVHFDPAYTYCPHCGARMSIERRGRA